MLSVKKCFQRSGSLMLVKRKTKELLGSRNVSLFFCYWTSLMFGNNATSVKPILKLISNQFLKCNSFESFDTCQMSINKFLKTIST